MKRRMALAALALAWVALAGCSMGAAPANHSTRVWAETSNESVADRFAPAPAAAAGTTTATEKAPSAPEADPARTQRIVIYNAVFSLVVDNIAVAQSQVERRVGALGGFMQRLSGNAIVVKVPADRFREAIAAVEQLGEVTQRDINGEDVTEQMRDLQIRLKNAEQMRDRLAKLLDQAQKMDDALKIERELERVAEAVELFKGRIRYLETNAAFSTLTVNFNSPLPQRRVEMEVPFDWVRALGGEVGTGRTGRPDIGWLTCSVAFKLPAGFIKYIQLDDETRAMSGDGVLLLVRRHENYEGGTAAFWAPCLRRALVAGRAFNIKKEPTQQELRDGATATWLLAANEVGGKRYEYLVALVAAADEVYTFEAWGEEKTFDAALPALMKSLESMRTRPWYKRWWHSVF